MHMASGIGRRRAAARAEGGAAYKDRRAEIIGAAASIFREKGFRATSLADIAEAVGTDRASLYYYVGSKDEMFHEIVREAADANAARAEAIRDEAKPATAKIADLVSSLLASYASHPYLFVYIQEDLSKVADGKSSWARQMRAINRRYDDAVVTIVRSGIEDGSLRNAGSPRLIANGIIGMLNWTHRWFHGDDTSQSAAEIAETFTRLLLDGLQAKRSARPTR
jgi:AcrR family transcriptional regulator